MNFRPFEPERDFPLMEDLHNRFNPDYHRTADDLRSQEEERPHGFDYETWVAELDCESLGVFVYGDQFWAHAPGRKIVEHYIDLERAPVCLRAILDWAYRRAAEDGTHELNIWSRDDRPKVNELVESDGFRLIETQPVSRLDLNAFDAAGRADSIPGLRFTTVAELSEQGVDWKRDWYDATREMAQDIPGKQKMTPSSFEQFCEWLKNPTVFVPEMMSVALDGERIVAYSGIRHSPANPGMGETGLSGTVRSHRRRGIVTALKVFSLKRAKARGLTVIQTDNLAHNPMFGINQRLGFRTAWSWLHYLKEL